MLSSHSADPERLQDVLLIPQQIDDESELYILTSSSVVSLLFFSPLFKNQLIYFFKPQKQIKHQLKQRQAATLRQAGCNITFLTTAWIKVPNRKRGNLPGSFPLKGVIRELTSCTCNAINGSTCERDLASTGNLDRVEHSKETCAAGAQPDPPGQKPPQGTGGRAWPGPCR